MDYGNNGNGRPLSFADYQRLIKERQNYVAAKQATDPDWQDWNRQAAAQTLDTYGSLASPTKDYGAEWLATLPKDVQADYLRHMADSKDWGDTVGKVFKIAIPALVGGAGLAATGLLGGGLQAAVGGAELGSTAGTAAAGAGSATTAADLALADIAGGLVPEFGTNAAYTAGLGSDLGWATAPSLGGVVNPGYGSQFSLLDPSTWTASDISKIGKAAKGLLGGGSESGQGPGQPPGLGGGMRAAYQPPSVPQMAPFRPHAGLADILKTMRDGRGLLS